MTTPEEGPRMIPLVDGTGRNKVAEATDPYMATAVSLSTPGYDGMAAMARTFVEEFAVMGWSRDHLLRMFRNTHLAAPRAVYEERGEAFVLALIDDVLGPAPPDGERTAPSPSDARAARTPVSTPTPTEARAAAPTAGTEKGS